MFQYALLLGISERCGFLVGLVGRADLDAYELGASPLDPAEVAKLRRYNEPLFHFSPQIFQLGDHVDYWGTFQSEKYFAHAADRVRREFTLKRELNVRVGSVLRELRADGKPLVGVHVRRGDYLRLPNQFPICGVDYYQRALQVLPRVRDARFVICSDDPEWCIDELAFLGDVTVSNRALSPPEDLALMAGCDHNIIANSAFGWWSAWLNPNPNKVVVAPKRWFGPLGPADAFDLVPETWLKI